MARARLDYPEGSRVSRTVRAAGRCDLSPAAPRPRRPRHVVSAPVSPAPRSVRPPRWLSELRSHARICGHPSAAVADLPERADLPRARAAVGGASVDDGDAGGASVYEAPLHRGRYARRGDEWTAGAARGKYLSSARRRYQGAWGRNGPAL